MKANILNFLKKKFRKVRRSVAGIKWSQNKKFKSEDSELGYYYDCFQQQGLNGLLETFFKNNPHRSKHQQAFKILKIAKYIYTLNADKVLRSNLAELSLSLDQSPSILKGVGWAAIHSANYPLAVRAISALNDDKVDHKEAISKLKASLASRLALSDIDTYLNEKKIDENTSLYAVSVQKIQRCNSYLKAGSDEALIDYLFNIYSTGQDVKVVEKLLVHLWCMNSLPIKEYQKILIQLGKKFSQENKKELDCYWAEKAIDIKKNSMAVRASFWSYQRAGNIAKSKESLEWLAEYAEQKNDKKLKEFVAKRQNSYLFLTAEHIVQLLKTADEFSINDYQAQDKTIAYVLHNSLPYASGGYATRGHGLAVALTQQGYRVEVVNRPGFPLDTKPELKEEDIIKPDEIEGVHYSRIPHPRRDKLATYEYLVQASEALYQRFLVLKPTIVMAASNHLTAIPAMIAARKLKIPFYYEVRGFWEVTRISREPEFEKTEWYKILCEFEALAANEANHVFTLTTPMKEELVYRGVDERKITLLPNSCNPENFIPQGRDQHLAKRLNIPENMPVIGYIGTFVQYEGLDHLAEACGLLKQKGVEFRLLIVGNENTAGTDRGPITQSILDVAKKYQFEEWLIMPGRIPHEEVESYYSLIDIAPFPRKPQPVTEMVSPMKPLEAAAMKKAIIASSVKALTDMIQDNKTGLIFEKGSIEDFSNKLEMLIENSDFRKELGENARFWVETQRTWGKTVESLISNFNKIGTN